MGQFKVFFGVHPIQSGADDGNCVAAAQHGAVMRRAVNAQRQPRHHADSCAAERPGKLPGVAFALRRRIAAADDGQAVCYFFNSCIRRTGERTHHVQHQRRIFDVEQGGRIGGIAQRRDAAVVSALQPVQRNFQLVGQTGRLGAKQAGQFARAQALQRGAALLENGLCRAESRKQLARRAIADAGRQRQPQPGLKFLGVHGKKRMSEVLKPGGATTGKVPSLVQPGR